MTTPILTAEQAAEVMLLAYAYRHGATSDALEAHLRSLTAPAPVQPAVKEALTTPFNPEALIRAVLPGGHSCDPQAVADDIREWARGHATPDSDEIPTNPIEQWNRRATAAPAQPVQAIAEPAQKLPSGTERLAKNQPLEVNLRHLATNPGAALLAFDEEWAGCVAASAFDEIIALKAFAVRMREALAELEMAGTAVAHISGSLRTEYCHLDLALIAARAALAESATTGKDAA